MKFMIRMLDDYDCNNDEDGGHDYDYHDIMMMMMMMMLMMLMMMLMILMNYLRNNIRESAKEESAIMNW